jgi:hypothetical protein
MFNSRSGRFNPFNRQGPAGQPQEPQQGFSGQPPLFGHPQQQPGYDPRMGPQPQNYNNPQYNAFMAQQMSQGGAPQPRHPMQGQNGPQPHPQQMPNGYGPNPQQYSPHTQSSSTAMTGPIPQDAYFDQPSLRMGPSAPRTDARPQQQTTRSPNTGTNKGPQANGDDVKGLSFWREDDEAPYQDSPEDTSEKSSPLKFVLIVGGLVVVSGISWLIYKWATQPSNNVIPLISAEQGPYKVRPENPGGMMVPHQDKLIYGRLTPSQDPQQVERLLPQDNIQYHAPLPQNGQPAPQAQAMQPSQPTDPYANNYQQQYPQPPQSVNVGPQQAPQQQYTPLPQQGPLTPEQQAYQQQLQLQQQQLAEQQQRQEAQARALAEQQAALQQAQAQLQGKASVKKDDVKATAEVAAAKQEVTVEAKPAAKAEKASTDTTTSDKTQKTAKETSATEAQGKPPVGYYMQLGSLPNDASAKTEWDRLRRKYSGELSEHTAFIRGTEGTSKKLYRILVGPFSNRNAALQKCVKIGGGCKVVQVGS